MTARGLQRASLYVEGSDDCHTIIHLLKRHGYLRGGQPREVELEAAGSDEFVLEKMRLELPFATNRTLGFVLDVDEDLSARWAQVTGILRRLGVRKLPRLPPPGGLIVDVAEYKARAGVWLMPDNRTEPGRLEDFIAALVPAGDPLLPHARNSTEEARSRHGAKFSAADTGKAVLHTWLAWQAEPGRPYGTAITAQFFDHDGPTAMSFLAWIRKLYRLRPA